MKCAQGLPRLAEEWLGLTALLKYSGDITWGFAPWYWSGLWPWDNALDFPQRRRRGLCQPGAKPQEMGAKIRPGLKACTIFCDARLGDCNEGCTKRGLTKLVLS